MSPAGPACLLCGATEVEAVLRLPRVPALGNRLWATAGEARRAATAPIELTFCHGCGALHNAAFDPGLVEYTPEYENSLHFSGRFQEFAAGLARRLVVDHRLRGGTVVEIGAGKGEFLALLCRAGVGQAIGYDPSYAGEAGPGDTRLTFVRDRFPSQPGALCADLVCARHVLEHLERPAEMLAAVRRSLHPGSQPVLYVEVPDGGHLLEDAAVWDLVYEHAWHFTPPALQALLASTGFRVRGLGPAFGGQFLAAEAVPVPGTPPPRRAAAAIAPDGASATAALAAAARRFARAHATIVGAWAAELRDLRRAGRRVAVWGIGSKGVTFLNTVPGAAAVDCAVDVNPRKHGRHVPGTGHVVTSPLRARGEQVDTVLVMNPLYLEEVRELTAQLGMRADVRPVDPVPAPPRRQPTRAATVWTTFQPMPAYDSASVRTE